MPRTAITPGDPPKWLTALGAIVLAVAIFLGVYLSAAVLGGLICGVSIRFHLPATGFTCRYLPSVLMSIVFFGFLFSMAGWFNALRRLVTRMYRVAFSGTDGEKSR